MYQPQSIEEIIQKNTPAIFRYCLSRLGNNHHYADEVTCEVMTTLFLKWDKLEKKHISAWLYRTADILILFFYKNIDKSPEICYNKRGDKNVYNNKK